MTSTAPFNLCRRVALWLVAAWSTTPPSQSPCQKRPRDRGQRLVHLLQLLERAELRELREELAVGLRRRRVLILQLGDQQFQERVSAERPPLSCCSSRSSRSTRSCSAGRRPTSSHLHECPPSARCATNRRVASSFIVATCLFVLDALMLLPRADRAGARARGAFERFLRRLRSLRRASAAPLRLASAPCRRASRLLAVDPSFGATGHATARRPPAARQHVRLRRRRRASRAASASLAGAVQRLLAPWLPRACAASSSLAPHVEGGCGSESERRMSQRLQRSDGVGQPTCVSGR